jgi:hypothetical protein
MTPFFLSVLRAGFIVGVLDAVAACTNSFLLRSVYPSSVFRYVASGVFGKEAFSGGTEMIIYGLVFHFTIAMAWTWFYYFFCARIRSFAPNKVIAGLSYGIFIWLAMNLIVLPLSNVGSVTYRLVPTIVMIGIHMAVIGLSISFLANSFFSKKS